MLYGGKRHFIYLAGNISDDPETYEWRERFRQIIEGDYFVCMDPCDNPFNQDHKEEINILRHDPSDHLGILMPKDYHMVKIASIFVANLELWTTEKPMIGTIVEHSWAYYDFKMPIIQIIGDGSSPYARHQWLRQMASARVPDEKEAAEVIRYFFTPGR